MNYNFSLSPSSSSSSDGSPPSSKYNFSPSSGHPKSDLTDGVEGLHRSPSGYGCGGGGAAGGADGHTSSLLLRRTPHNVQQIASQFEERSLSSLLGDGPYDGTRPGPPLSSSASMCERIKHPKGGGGGSLELQKPSKSLSIILTGENETYREQIRDWNAELQEILEMPWYPPPPSLKALCSLPSPLEPTVNIGQG